MAKITITITMALQQNIRQHRILRFDLFNRTACVKDEGGEEGKGGRERSGREARGRQGEEREAGRGEGGGEGRREGGRERRGEGGGEAGRGEGGGEAGGEGRREEGREGRQEGKGEQVRQVFQKYRLLLSKVNKHAQKPL